MKVGIYLDDYVPEDGGGFMFQAEVFGSLRNLAASAEHEFVILAAPNKSIQRQLAGTSLQWLSCPRDNPWERVVGIFVRTWPSLRSRWHWQSPLDRRARRAGIEFIWFLGPRHPDIDLPYLTIVLDLQHRLQPWFPEVSSFGEWQNREKHYALRLRRAAAIIAGTNAGKQEIERFYQIPAERIHILAHPTPTFALNAKSNDDGEVLGRLNLRPGYLFYPAQFWAHKNHVNLLRAIKLLKEKGENHQVVLTGADFGNKAYVQERVKDLGLKDQVHFLGFVEQEVLVALYRNSFALTYVSFFGPENMPPIEAFALGCPVVAARVSGSEEQLGGAALLVDPADPADIADAILRLSDKTLRETLIARGRQRAGGWTTEDFVRGVFSVLDSFEPIRSAWKD